MKRSVVSKSSSALYLLFAEGFCILLVAVAVIALGFSLNYHDDFDYDQVDFEHDYTQYWVGFVLLITAFIAIAAGAFQRNRWLIISAMFLFFVSILVLLFALVIEGNDWIQHKNNVRRKGFWESEDYECTSPTSTSCICSHPNGGVRLISQHLGCKTLERLDYLYGGLICCFLIAVFLALSSIIIVMIFIPIRTFTVPVPKKKIKKITVLEDKPEPIVVYKPKKVVEPKPKVQEIVVRERRPPPVRMIVEPRPEPKPEVEEIVIRERHPQRVRTIIYDEPRQQKPEVVYRIPRTRTLVYDEPRPEPRPVQTRTLVPIEPPPEPPKDQIVYDVGRFAPKVHPTPIEPEVGKDFIVNPNFKKETTLSEPEEPKPVHYGKHEVVPPVRYVQQEPAPVQYVRREEPQQVRYVRKPTVVYERRPRVVEQRAIVPVVRPRPKGRMIIHSERPRPSYIIRKPGHRPVVAVRRRRAYSDEGPGLFRARRERPQPRRRVYTTQVTHPPRTYTTRPEAPRVVYRRARANSDEGPRLYREPVQRAGPARIYTDKEIAMAGGNPVEAPSGAAKPRVFNEENIGTANLGYKPATAHINQAQGNEDYDRILEANLSSADKWEKRPATPY